MIEPDHYSGDGETGAPGPRSIRYGIAAMPVYDSQSTSVAAEETRVSQPTNTEVELFSGQQPVGEISFRTVFARYAVVSAVAAVVAERVNHPNWIPIAAISAACAVLAARTKD